MNVKPKSPLSRILLFLLDTLLAWALAASTAILFHCVMLNSFPDKVILIICAIAVPVLMLFLKSKIFRLVTLFLIAASSLAILGLLVLSVFFSEFRSVWTSFISVFSDWAMSPDTPPLLVVLLTSMLSSVIVAHGKRLVYLFVLLPPVALIILSLFYASFPHHVLAIYTVSAVALVLRKKYDWFLTLLSGWPTTNELLNDSAYGPDSSETTREKKKGNKLPPSRVGLGFPNVLVRTLLLIVTAVVAVLIFRPIPTPGPMFGEDFSHSVEMKFQSWIESSDFLSRLFGIEGTPGSNKNRRLQGTYGKLGGPADLGNEPILLVKSSKPGIYLRGFTYGEYTKNRWVKDILDSSELPLGGEAPYSKTVMVPFGDLVIRYNPGWAVNYTYYSNSTAEKFWESRKHTVAVQYLSPYDARFGVFAPPLTRAMNFFDDKYNYYNLQSDLRLRMSTGKNIIYHSDLPQPWAAYALDYMDIDEDAVNALKLYDFCTPGYYNKMLADLGETDPYRGYEYRKEMNELRRLSAYSSMVTAQYLRLPYIVSYDVRELAQNITAGIPSNDYWKRAVAIKNFLLSGYYEYSLTPEELPDGVDILDQFLFRERKGYCTYFATAMTVLARAAGVPARYVEGFYVSSDTLTDDGLYMLTEQNLHAWCEIYLEGVGFVPIEATAGFGRVTDPSATATPRPTATPPAETSTPELPTEEPSATPAISEEPTESVDPGLPTALPTDVPSPTQDPGTVVTRHLPLAIKILIILLIPVILIILLAVLLNRLATRKPGRNGTPSERVVSVYKRSSALLREFGYKRNAEETPREFSDRIKAGRSGDKKDLPENAVSAFDRLTGMYEKALYGDLSENELVYADAVRCWDEIVDSLEQSRGKLRTRMHLIYTIGK